MQPTLNQNYYSCYRGDIPTLMQRHIAIIRLEHPTNMGDTCHDVQLFVLILCPGKEVNLLVNNWSCDMNY